mgnify:FL=1
MEVLQGFRSQRDFLTAKEHINEAPLSLWLYTWHFAR